MCHQIFIGSLLFLCLHSDSQRGYSSDQDKYDLCPYGV